MHDIRSKIAAWIPRLAVAVMPFFFFSPTQNGVFGLDDPQLIFKLKSLDSNLLVWALSDTAANRWRPTTNLLHAGIYSVFSNDYQSWWWVNYSLVIAFGLGLYAFTFKYTKSSYLAAALALTLITSRFLQYNITQAYGVMESLCLLLVLGISYFCLKFFESSKYRYFVCAWILFFAVCLTHERFQALVAPLVVLFLFQRGKTLLNRLVQASLFLVPVAFVSLMKLVVFRVPLFIGTGSATEVGFRPDTSLEHTKDLILSVLGINSGPPYLNGLTFEGQSLAQRVLSLTVLVSAVMILVLLIRMASKTSFDLGITPTHSSSAFWLLILSLSIPAVITIRLEPRWLTSVFLVGILFVVLVSGKTSLLKNKWFSPLVIVFVLGSLTNNFSYWRNFDNVYFRADQIASATYVEQLKPTWARANDLAEPIYFVAIEGSQQAGEYFDRLVVSNSKLPSQIVVGIDTASPDSLMNSGLVVYFDATTGKITIGK